MPTLFYLPFSSFSSVFNLDFTGIILISGSTQDFTPRFRLRQGRVELGGTVHSTDEKTEAQRRELDMAASHRLVITEQGFK